MEHSPWTPLEEQDALELGRPTIPVCPVPRRVLGCKTFSAKTWQVLGKLGHTGHPIWSSVQVAPLSTGHTL